MQLKFKGLAVLIVIIVGIVGFFSLKSNTSEKNPQEKIATTPLSGKLITEKYLLPTFPLKEVPLLKLKKISSSKIFVNTDPNNTSAFNDKNYAYYNVVFETEANQSEFLDYYKNLFESSYSEEFSTDSMVKGYIKNYKVTAAHYGSGNTVYLQVYLPNYQENIDIATYFKGYPTVLNPSELFVEHEKSYGILNQKGGEIEYTKYFTVINSGDRNKDGKDDRDEITVLIAEYQAFFKNEKDYSFDGKTNTFNWSKDEFRYSLVVSREHGRVYFMARKPF